MTDHYEARCPSCGGSDEQGCYADCPKDELTRLRSDLEKAKKALKPFARIASYDAVKNADHDDTQRILLTFYIGDFRTAARIFSQLENSK